jgi:hypothetical protein
MRVIQTPIFMGIDDAHADLVGGEGLEPPTLSV